jgi:glycosyltransferase 2 family protein
MRKFLLAIALLLGIFFIFSRFTEFQSVVATLQRGEFNLILAAILLLFVWSVNIAACYRAVYEIVGVDEKISRLLLLSLSAFFVNVVAPVAGMSGIALFVSDARLRGHSPARITVATALFILFDYAGFLVVLTLGLAVLARRNQLGWAEISASIILVIIALGIFILLYLGAKSEQALEMVLVWSARLVNKTARSFIHRDYLSIERAISFAQEASEGLGALRKTPVSWIKPFILAINTKAILITIMMLVFLAFEVPFTAGTIIAGFSIGYLFLVVSPTPSGIGLMEGVMTLTLSSLHVPLEAAAIIVIAYRGITFWIPLLAGMITFRIYSATNKLQESGTPN